MTKYTCLSIRQPWAWLIMQGYKDVENRSQQCHKRGTIALHASGQKTKQEYAQALDLIADRGLAIELPPIEELVTMAIVGLVDIVDCVESHESPWFTGDYGIVLANPRSGIPQPQKGQQGFFDVDYDFKCLPEISPQLAAALASNGIDIKKPTPDYGQCHKCQGAIVIPGVDRYCCSKCGWQYHINEMIRIQKEEDTKAANRRAKKGEVSTNHYQN